ncbi:DUF3493 domain-containing protein [Burkholderia arboris]|uniref:DUF3493 domain-containing protein n=1 Tax=Burkholderia arboris TaxID=488730 RepID=UPI001CF43316|nr:DUF3493 domain-containing protein [Burkholderia arboris]MCA8050875.1 DUF3493 domain-containing protein [Burkholderia arboris]HEP6430611.1 hypothetical protein [Burkholderia cenocepacia]
MANTTVEMMGTKNREAYEGSGVTELVIGVLMMLAGIGLFIYAFQTAATDAPYTASAWLFGLAVGAVGVFVWSGGVRKQRIAFDLEQQKATEQKAQADAQVVASEAIERARKK